MFGFALVEDLRVFGRLAVEGHDGFAHLSTIEELDAKVNQCMKALKIVPSLAQEFPDATQVVQEYFTLKKIIPKRYQ